jgi:hypothetical protein
MENFEALGGMRRPNRSVQQLGGYRIVGAEIPSMAEQFISQHPHTFGVVQDLRKGVTVTGSSDDAACSPRNEWFQTLGVPIPDRLPGSDADSIKCWGRAVGDPDAAEILPRWLRQSAPIGSLEHINTANIFPAVVPMDPARNPDSLFFELAGWANYASAED